MKLIREWMIGTRLKLFERDFIFFAERGTRIGKSIDYVLSSRSDII